MKLLWEVILLFAITAKIAATDEAEPKRVWIPTPGFGTVKPTPVTPAPPPTPAPPLLAYEIVALNEINGFRATHGVAPLTWDATLATRALACANEHVRLGTLVPCTNLQNAGEEVGLQENDIPSQGTRGIIVGFETGPAGGWMGQQWNSNGAGAQCISWTPGPPMYNSACSAYSQMIWNATTTVGCGYSASKAAFAAINPAIQYHVLSCLYDPPGNIPGGLFVQNVFEDKQ